MNTKKLTVEEHRIELRPGVFALVDAPDLERTLAHRWSAHWSPFTGTFYVHTNIRVAGKRKTLGLHRLILNAPADMLVDHVNGDTLDNRRANLRLATRSQNIRNSKVRRNSATGIKGVQLRENGKYRAYINVNRARVSLGTFPTLTEAKEAYIKAAITHCGEFARVA